jgi:hypothetical protein
MFQILAYSIGVRGKKIEGKERQAKTRKRNGSLEYRGIDR